MSKLLPDEIQILCPRCGCLSPKNTTVCDCGYRLRASSAAYVVLFLVCFAVFIGAIFISYGLGRSSSAAEAEKQIASISEAYQRELADQTAEYERLLSDSENSESQPFLSSDDRYGEGFSAGWYAGKEYGFEQGKSYAELRAILD